MEAEIKKKVIGKLRIYLKVGEKVKSEKLIHKLFPTNKYRKILDEAKKSGLMNAHIYHTHAAYENGGELHHRQVEGDNGGLTVCIELVDEREKLEAFCKSHKSILSNKTIVYKEVELWKI